MTSGTAGGPSADAGTLGALSPTAFGSGSVYVQGGSFRIGTCG